jgi:YesN/AraC family two-component response regulator
MVDTLIVEDNGAFRALLREIVETSFPQAQVRTARDAEEALELLCGRVPDLVITDVCLPGLNGLELTRRIKAVRRRTTVVVLTSHDLLEYRQAALSSGADHFLVKGGVSRAEFIALIGSLVRSDHVPPAAAAEG